jgi:RND superfamily putative drug exporter
VVPSVEPSSAAGPSARLVDTKASLFGHLPAAAVVIALVTFVLLFLMTGRIVTTAPALLAIVFVAFATSQSASSSCSASAPPWPSWSTPP